MKTLRNGEGFPGMFLLMPLSLGSVCSQCKRERNSSLTREAKILGRLAQASKDACDALKKDRIFADFVINMSKRLPEHLSRYLNTF